MSSAHDTTLKAEKRSDLSHHALRKLRESGKVPGIIYGSQIESQPLAVDEKDLVKVSRTGRAEFFQLAVAGGESYPALIKDIQMSKGKIAHVDFQHVSRNKPLRVNIPVHYAGTAAGTSEGGILQTLVLELEVEGLPDNLPAGIEVDVTKLGVGDKVTAAEVTLPDGVTLHTAEDTLLASVILPRVADVEDTEDAEASAEQAEGEGAGNAETEA